MKKLLLLVLLLFSLPAQALEHYGSHSFMYFRPAAHNLASEQALWHYYSRTKQGPVLGCLQILPFYQKTGTNTDYDDKAATYFMPHCKQVLTVQGDSVIPIHEPRDVRAEWLGINNPNFSGRMSLHPHQQQFGVILEYQQDLAEFTASKFFEPFWFSLMLPFVVVKNDPGLRQFEVQNPGSAPGPSDIVQAFNQATWRFDRIGCGARKSGLAEAKVKFGVNFATRRDAEVGLYTIASFPTASRQQGTYLFAPFLGNNAHYIYGTGANFQIPFSSEWDERQIFLFAEIEHLYMWGNTQLRTFDLHGKPWSRFMMYNSSDGFQTNVPGVNVLTRKVHVRPDSFVDFVTGFRGRWNNMLEIELGYNLWAHGHERIELMHTTCHECDEEIPISLYGIAGSGPGVSASNSTIAQLAPDDTTFQPLNISDIDLESGGAGATITNRLHGSIGYGYSGCSFAGFIAFGGFYEGPMNNASFQQWGVWAKIGASF